jgi:hypothetical protein
MSRDPLEPPPEVPDSDPEPPSSGHLSTTGPGPLTAFAVAGLVLGWSIRPLWVWQDLTAPRVGWLQAAVLWFAGLLLLWVARATSRAITRRGSALRSHEAVNRLVLAKASALAGAMVGGGYLGYALSWVGVGAETFGPRVWMSLVAALGAVLTVTASLLLERACRIRSDDEVP